MDKQLENVFQDAKFDPLTGLKDLDKYIPEYLIKKRRTDLALIMRWLMPWHVMSEKDSTVRYRLAVCLPKGQGRTVLYTALCETIIAMRQEVPCYVIGLDKDGYMAFDTTKDRQNMPGAEKKLIAVLDGLFDKKDPANKPLISAFKDSMMVAFVESGKELSKWLGEDVFTLDLEGMTYEDLIEIADKYDFLPKEDKKSRESVEMRVRDMVSQEAPAKAIIEHLGVSSGLLMPTRTAFAPKTEAQPKMLDFLVHRSYTAKALPKVELAKLESFLKKKVIGQDRAVKAVAEAVGVAQFGLNEPDTPMLRALFLGPTGVGKTSLASGLSDALFGGKSITRVDMGEYTQPHHVEKLFGSSPSYVGYGQDTYLVSQIKKAKSGVLLFDEIEKAHPDVHNALLQVMDAGRLTTGQGEELDLRKYFIILTSNALADKLGVKVGLGFGNNQNMLGSSDKEIREMLGNSSFSKEFLNRIDDIVLFTRLTPEMAKSISQKHISEYQERLNSRGVKLIVADSYHEHVLMKYDHNFGGRSIKRVNSEVKAKIVDVLLANPNARELLVEADNKVSVKA